MPNTERISDRIIISADAYARAHADDQYSPHARIARDAVKADVTELDKQLQAAAREIHRLRGVIAHVSNRVSGLAGEARGIFDAGSAALEHVPAEISPDA